MQEASLSEVLRVILIIMLVYFGIKLIIRWFGPILLRYIIKRVGKKFGQNFSQFDTSRKPNTPPGKVSIDKNPKKKGKSKKDVGEYIDYEEID